ncbi:MAG: hypothetical protein RLZZ565_710 [Planctomycetota bacterium]
MISRENPVRHPAPTVRALLLLIASLVSWSCASPPPRPSADDAAQAAAFDEDLDRFGLAARDLIDAATLANLEGLDDKSAEKRLAARRTVVDRLNRSSGSGNSMVSLIDLWWSAEMLLQSSRNGQIKDLFGSEAPGIEEAATRMSDQVEQMARRYLPSDKVDQIKVKVVDAAKQEELLTTQIESVATGRVAAGARGRNGDPANGIVNMLALPLSPFTAAKSVETGVAEVVVQAQDFNRQFQRLPEQTRIQAERLLQEFYLSPIARATVENLNAVGAASTSLAKTAEALPVQLRQQASQLLEESRQSQQVLSETVANARATASEVNAAITNLGEQRTGLEAAIEKAGGTAAAWEKTVVAVQGVLDTVERIQGPPPPPGSEPSEPSFSFEQLDESAVKLQQASIELQGVLDRVITILDDPSTARIEGLADRTIEDATASGLTLVDAIFWRSLAVVGLAVAGLVAFGIVRRAK